MTHVYDAHYYERSWGTSTAKRQSRPTEKYEEVLRYKRTNDSKACRKPPKLCELASKLMSSMPVPLPQPIVSRRNTSGFFGVYATTNLVANCLTTSYQARVKHGVEVLYLGTYNDALEAGRIAAGVYNQIEEKPIPDLTNKWTNEEDDQLSRVVMSASFGNACNTPGWGGRTTPQFWAYVAKAMGMGDSLRAARRCGRRWWRIDPNNKKVVDDAREKITRRRHSRIAAQHGKVAEDAFAELLDCEVPLAAFVDMLAEEPVVVDAEPVVAILAKPVVVDLHAHEFLSDVDTQSDNVSDNVSDNMSDVSDVSKVSDVSVLSDVSDVDNLHFGGYFPKVVKCVSENKTKHQVLRYDFKATNLGSGYRFQRTNLFNLTQKRRVAISAAKRRCPDSPALVVKAWPMPQPQQELLPELVPQFQDSPPECPFPTPVLQAPPEVSLAPPLVQDHIDCYLKICKASSATTKATTAELVATAAEATTAAARLLDFEQLATLGHN